MVRRSLAVGALAVFAGCTPADGVPAWGFDPIYVEPTADGVHAVVSWELFSSGWSSGYGKRHYVCGVLVDATGTPADACEGCERAWDMSAQLLDSDCEDEILSAVTLPTLTGLGLGEVPSDLIGDDPYPNQSSGGYIRYGSEPWLPHGWAYPESLDATGAALSSAWDDELPFTFWPAFAVEL